MRLFIGSPSSAFVMRLMRFLMRPDAFCDAFCVFCRCVCECVWFLVRFTMRVLTFVFCLVSGVYGRAHIAMINKGRERYGERDRYNKQTHAHKINKQTPPD